MEALIGWALPYIIAAGAAIFGAWRIWAGGKKAGRNEERAEHAKARAKNLDRIRDAADARPRDDIVSDPNNRDNR